MVGTAVSKNGIPIRLTEERWFHIVENHDELAGLSDEVLLTIEDPVYKELENDGFIITAFITKKIDKVLRRGIVWQKK